MVLTAELGLDLQGQVGAGRPVRTRADGGSDPGSRWDGVRRERFGQNTRGLFCPC